MILNLRSIIFAHGAAPTALSIVNPSEVAVAGSDDLQEIRALFLRQAAGETAHDIEVIDSILARAPAGQPDPVNFVARAYTFWGREAVLDHFRTIFAGTWQFEPDEAAMRVIPLGPDVAHIYAPTRITAGAAGQPGTTYQFLINEFAIRTPDGWRISAIVPVPTQ
jgi:SnoaL-like domain